MAIVKMKRLRLMVGTASPSSVNTVREKLAGSASNAGGSGLTAGSGFTSSLPPDGPSHAEQPPESTAAAVRILIVRPHIFFICNHTPETYFSITS